MNLQSQLELRAGLQDVELEGNPIRPPKGPGKYLQKSGSLWCVRSGNPQDKNFGCFNSKQQAEDVMNGKSFTGLEAYGTSQGAQKAWDSRGRGRKAKAIKLNPRQIKQEYSEVGTRIKTLGKLIKEGHEKLDTEHVKSTAGMMAHIVKALGEWHHGLSQFVDLLKRIGEGMGWVVGLASVAEHSQAIHSLLLWAHNSLGPIVHAVASSGVLNSEADDIDAANLSQYGQTGWQYGKRQLARSTGFLPTRGLAGFPSVDRQGGRGIGRVSRPPGMRAPARVRTPQPKVSAPLHIKYPTAKVANIGKAPSVPKPRNTSVPRPSMPKMSVPTGMGKKSMLAEFGEPMAGDMAHAHIDPVVWFHPPSLTKREKNETTRIPTDEPGETNDKFLDVTKRNSKDTEEMRMKLLKRKAPGGDPPMVPAHTTLLAPATAAYMPSGLYASRSRQRRKAGGGNYTSYNRKGCI